jgi:hypothetical protein
VDKGEGNFCLATLMSVSIARIFQIVAALESGFAIPLFVPNEYMPGAVRLRHFFELLIENFVFGATAVSLFQP